jgi:hypothetical protein
MRGNLILAVLTLAVALCLLVPALLANWHSDRKRDGDAGSGTANSEAHRAGRRPQARRPLTPVAPYPTTVHHSVHKVTVTGGPGSGGLGGPS